MSPAGNNALIVHCSVVQCVSVCLAEPPEVKKRVQMVICNILYSPKHDPKHSNDASQIGGSGVCVYVCVAV